MSKCKHMTTCYVEEVVASEQLSKLVDVLLQMGKIYKPVAVCTDFFSHMNNDNLF